MKTFFLSILTFAFSVSAHAAMAPDFSLPDTAGVDHNLSDYRGKYVVLEWFNPDCPFVKKHYNPGNMQSLQEEYTGQDVVWFSINSSAPGKQGNYSPEEHQAMMDEKEASATAILLDPDGTVGRLYDAKTTPHMFVVNPEGEIIYQGAIDSNSSWNSDDIPGATNYVRQALDEAMSGGEVSEPKTKPYGCSVKY